MPELPEVETIKNDLSERILAKRIRRVTVRKSKMINGSVSRFVGILEGNMFTGLSRIGKLLVFILADGRFMLLHLKMTGQLIYRRRNETVAGGHGRPAATDRLPNKYSHVIFEFDDGSCLFFNDMRQFGYLRLTDRRGLEKVKAGYGTDPLSREFTPAVFRDKFAGRTAPVKAVLLNQSLIAGIGNIYADEILFRAGIRPDKRSDTLTGGELSAIYKAVRPILKRAVKYRGTTFNDYVDARGRKGDFVRMLKAYGRAGEKCRRCRRGVIRKTRVAQRGTCYCPVCQK